MERIHNEITCPYCRIHNEITCPYCRMQLGGYKISNNKVDHLDIFWSYESGLIKECKQQEFILQNIVSIDDHQNPEFTEEFKKKIEDLKDKFFELPDDVTKDNHSWEDYFLAFCNCMNWGYVDGENEEYDRENMTTEKIEEMYNNGINLYEALRFYIKPITETDLKEEILTPIKEEVIDKKKTIIDKIKNIFGWKK